ncbi:MAG: SDR family oxidoreductase [Alphaproteobacteria bacterium]|nr:SDR family oxidoreductase [Alphaproteobacteria bacterium]
MNTGLADRVVLITGASGGIGRALARTFADEGALLVLHGHARSDALAAWVAAQDWRDRAVAVTADLRDPDAVSAAFLQGEARFGRVDVAVANAGAYPGRSLPLDRIPTDRIRDTVEVNLLGAAWTARSFMDGLRRHGPRPGEGASLCFIGSTAGRFGEAGHADYSLAKAGLHGLVRSLKNEVVRIDPLARVNMVEPGWTVTEMARASLEAPGAVAGALRTMPVRQLARAVDIARAVAVLSSPTLSRHTSGEVLTIAGGMEGRVQWDPADIDEDAVRQRAKDPG